jgi:mRNA-degrading endonuclease YafQ of YafQ-DinJ toxin-antitoxin module
MRIHEKQVSRLFKKQFHKFPVHIKKLMVEKESIFLSNPHDHRLKTHKLHGVIPESWAFSINQAYRVTFIFLSDHAVFFTEVGTHDIYK